MNIRPLHDRLVVRRLEDETTTPGGIFLPGSASKKPSRGSVLAVGPGKVMKNGDTQPCGLKADDTIIFSEYGGSTVRIDDEELLILSESEVLGVLEG